MSFKQSLTCLSGYHTCTFTGKICSESGFKFRLVSQRQSESNLGDDNKQEIVAENNEKLGLSCPLPSAGYVMALR